MGVFAGPEIVEDGLVLALDAGNPKSYPGSGTTWGDLSGNGNNGTLTNGPTYSNGSIVFDGVNDYVSLDTQSILTGSSVSLTLNMWVYFNILTNNQFYTLFSYGGYVSGGWLFQRAGTNKWRFAFNGNELRDTSNTFSTTSEWVYISVTVDNGIPQGVYVNNSLELFTSLTGTLNTTEQIVNIGRRYDSTSQYVNGSISNITLYNKALTASEIQQNFNATRSRFGI